MAMAGYDPKVAVPFWQRMSQGGGGKPPEFMSTHPSDETRIANLNKLMPEAMKYYQPGTK
jgi:predicted Zn-dependent protease